MTIDANDIARLHGAEGLRKVWDAEQSPTSQNRDLDGAKILAEVHEFLGRFVAYPSEHAHVAHTLWIAHTHLMEVWESTPRLAFLSAEPGSGKTRALEVTSNLVPRPIEAINVTPAYLFRVVGDPHGAPTLLFDEIDTVFGPKAKNNEEIRGLLNAGHRKNAVAGRCIIRGKTIETEEIPAYCAVALAGIGHLPDTILSRSIAIRMRRRAPEETVEAYRFRIHEPEGISIRIRLASWVSGIADSLIDSWPDMPQGINDRDADVWEPLITVANAAGSNWRERANVAAVALVALSKKSSPSIGTRLLSDLREIFADHHAMSTESILSSLHRLDDAPWSDLGGKPLDSRGLAKYLRDYEVKPKNLRIRQSTLRGYARADLHDAWKRYLARVS